MIPSYFHQSSLILMTIIYVSVFVSVKDAHDYLRSLLKMGELSERALKLTEIALNINAANYTTWKYR